MKYMTTADIATLRAHITAKTDMINAYERMIKDIRSKYSTMTDKQLAAAVMDVQSMKRDIADERVWIRKAEAQIARFYRPAC